MYFSINLDLHLFIYKIDLFTVTGSIIRNTYDYFHLYPMYDLRESLIRKLDTVKIWSTQSTLLSDDLICIPSNLKESVDIVDWILNQINPLLLKYAALDEKYKNEIKNIHKEYMTSLKAKTI